MSTLLQSNGPINLLSNNESRNEFTHELDAAIDMHMSSKSVPFFRNLLNERQFPLSAQAAKLAPTAKVASWQYQCPVCVGTARAEHIGWLVKMRDRVSSQQAFEDLQDRITDLQSLTQGCQLHDVDYHQTRDELSPTRPSLNNVVWKQWLGDPTRSLVIVQQTMTKTVQVSTDIFESEPKPITFDRFFVVMCEEAVLTFATEYELAVANQIYFGRGVGLAKWMVQPRHVARQLTDGSMSKDRRKPKTWTVLEPVEEFHMAGSSIADAESICDNWSSQLNAEYYDNMDAWLEVERPSSSKWTKDAQ